MITDTSQNYMYLAGTTNSLAISVGFTDFLLVRYSFSSTGVSWIGTLGSTSSDTLDTIAYYDSNSTTKGLYLIGHAANLASGNGATDIIVIKMNPSSMTIDWQLYLGGTVDEIGYSSLIDSTTGTLYIGGITNSIEIKRSLLENINSEFPFRRTLE